MINNKKGGFLDWFLVLTLLFIFSVTIFVSYIIIDTADNVNIFKTDTVAQNSITSAKNTILSFDNMFLFAIVGLSIFVLVSSALVKHHPAYFICGFIILCIAITVAATVSNTFWIFSNTSQVAATTANFPKITFLMNKLPFYVAFMGTLAAILMFVSLSRDY